MQCEVWLLKPEGQRELLALEMDYLRRSARVSRLQKTSQTINFRQNAKKAIEMVWTPPQNGSQSLVKEDLPVDTARWEEKRKIATIMEEPSDGLHENQKLGRRYDRR